MRTRQAPAAVQDQSHAPAGETRRYRVELPGELIDEQGAVIDWLLSVAFDTLDARMLSIRVVPAEVPTPSAPAHAIAYKGTLA